MTESEGTEKIQLEFRSADDLFQNYSVSIVRQVVDRSKATIDSKRREMRELVGAKYTDLLRSANTMAEMHKTFEGVEENISSIVKVLDSSPENESNQNSNQGKNESVKSENTSEGSEIDVRDFFFPEYLFGLYDNNQYVEVIVNVLRARSILEEPKGEIGCGHIQWGILSGFPRLVEEGSKKIFLQTETDNKLKSDCLVALTIFYGDVQQSFNLYINTIQEYIRSAAGNSAYTPELLIYVYKSLSLLYDVYIKEGNYLTTTLNQLYERYSFLPRLSLSLSDSLLTVLQSWVYDQLSIIRDYTSTYINTIKTINQLAQLKRQLISTIEDIEEPFASLCKEILHIEISLYNYLYNDIFLEYSYKLVALSYQTTQKEIEDTLHNYIYNINNVPETVSLDLYSPLFSLYTDIQDLNILQSDKDDIQKELLKIFNTIINLLSDIYNDVSKNTKNELLLKQYLLLSYFVYLFSVLLQHILDNDEKSEYHSLFTYLNQYDIEPIQNLLGIAKDLRSNCLSSFISTAVTVFSSDPSYNNDIYSLYIHDYWENNKVWLDTHCYWAECVLHNEDDTIEDTIHIPTQPVPALLPLYMFISKQYQYIHTLSIFYPDYQNECRYSLSSALSKELITIYIKVKDSIASEIKHPSSYGIIQILFDLYVISNTLYMSEETSKQLHSVLDSLFTYIDPIDWTLSEQYINNNVKYFINSTSILTSPLISTSIIYTLNSTSILNDSSSCTDITFTPIDNLQLYPIPTRPLQMILQQYIQKNM